MSVSIFLFGFGDYIKMEKINKGIVWKGVIILNEKKLKRFRVIKKWNKEIEGKKVLIFYKYLRSD